MKKAVCLLLACLLFALTACAPEQSAPSGDHASLSEHDNWVAREEKQVFPDFAVFEAEIDSEQYYKLEAVEVPGLSVFVSEGTSVATVRYMDKTMDIKIVELFPEDGAVASFELHDLTGDGIPEVCYFHINGGTGACDTDLSIVDVAAMREIQVESPAEFFENRISYTLLSKGERSATYEVTCGALSSATGTLYTRDEDEAPVLVVGEYYTLLNVQDDLLCCEVGFTMSNAEPGHHLGFARGRYAYNETTGALEVSEETKILGMEIFDNPYVESYLAAIERENAAQSGSVEPDKGVIDALNNYYEDDLKLTQLLRDYISDEEVLAQVAAYDREDKINAMHHIEAVYPEIEDEECIAMIKEYLVRYAVCSEDEQATAFFYSALGLTDHSKDL